MKIVIKYEMHGIRTGEEIETTKKWVTQTIISNVVAHLRLGRRIISIKVVE